MNNNLVPTDISSAVRDALSRHMFSENTELVRRIISQRVVEIMQEEIARRGKNPVLDVDGMMYRTDRVDVEDNGHGGINLIFIPIVRNIDINIRLDFC